MKKFLIVFISSLFIIAVIRYVAFADVASDTFNIRKIRALENIASELKELNRNAKNCR